MMSNTEKEIADHLASLIVFTVPKVEDYQDAIQRQVDATAMAKKFNDGVTLASYSNSTNVIWQAQSVTFIAWRDAVWQFAYAELERVMTGQRPQPTVSEFLAELPAIIWPE